MARAGGRSLNRQMLGFNRTCKPLNPPKPLHVGYPAVTGRKTNIERGASSGSRGGFPCPAPAAEPRAETTAWWRTGPLSQWSGLGLCPKCSSNRNGSKSPVICIISEAAGWEGEEPGSGLLTKKIPAWFFVGPFLSVHQTNSN